MSYQPSYRRATRRELKWRLKLTLNRLHNTQCEIEMGKLTHYVDQLAGVIDSKKPVPRTYVTQLKLSSSF